ncbi:hypothetical protein SK128_005378, partial [Halocaridina rubra]
SAYSMCTFGDECEPNCTGHLNGEEVSDPKNCTRFYVCMPGEMPSDFPFSCPPDTEFQETVGCVPPYGCEPICKGSPACHMTCLSVGDYIADPIDCTAYYVCDISGPSEANHCPGSFPNYDPVAQKCADDESVCCKPGCEPQCEATSVQVPDPTDCTKFYQCYPNPIYPPVSCPDGEVFNIGTGHCDPTAECKAWCSPSNYSKSVSV